MKIKLGKPKLVYKGRILKVTTRDVTLPMGKKSVFEYCERPDSVTILAFDDKGRLLLTKERRRYDQEEVSWFLPGGRVDREKDPDQAAHRELREETGFDAMYLKQIYQRPSGSTMIIWNVHVYVAKGLFPSPLPGDEEFKIEVVPTNFAKAVKMALNGEIENEFLAYHIIRFNYMLKKGLFKW